MAQSGIEEKLLPVAPLKIAYLEGSYEIASAVDANIARSRHAKEKKNEDLRTISGYVESSYLLDTRCSWYGTGEGKARINESVRGTDLFIIADVTNHTVTYKVCGKENRMSPDNHFQNLKRIISAANGKAHRINVIMPFLYEGRQHKRNGRESLDCALALKELSNYGVANIITFDAHDPRVMNAVPLCGFDNYMPTYQFMRALLKAVPDLVLDSSSLMIISPDEGALPRTVYFANILGVDMGMFYKRRDYSKVVNGRNPIVAHEFLGDSVEGKDVIIIDDMISSGGSMLDVCRQIKEKGARRVFVCATFGLFTDGLAAFDEYYEKGYLDKLITTNLTYRSPELLERPYYETANMFNYLASIIDILNHDTSVSRIKSTTQKLTRIVSKHQFLQNDDPIL